MKPEYYFILICFLIPFIQILSLFIIKYLPSKFYYHKNRFKISLIFVWLVFFISALRLEIDNLLLIFCSFLFVISLNIFIYTFWSLVAHGFTLNLLYSLPHNRNSISIKKWIKKYTHGNDLSYFTLDRLPILTNLFFAKKNKDKLSITHLGIISNKIFYLIKAGMFIE